MREKTIILFTVLDDIARNLKLPKKYDTVTLYPTNIVSVTEFFAQLTSTRSAFEVFQSKLQTSFMDKQFFATTSVPGKFL